MTYPPILNKVVPQTGQRPFMALRPFFIVMACGFCISRFVLHLTQYAVVDFGLLAPPSTSSAINYHFRTPNNSHYDPSWFKYAR
jgi:hypothetical protein